MITILRINSYSYYCAPGTLLSTLHVLIHLILMTNLWQINLPAIKLYRCSYKISNSVKSYTKNKRPYEENNVELDYWKLMHLCNQSTNWNKNNPNKNPRKSPHFGNTYTKTETIQKISMTLVQGWHTQKSPKILEKYVSASLCTQPQSIIHNS